MTAASPILGIGVDIVEHARFGEVLARRPLIAARIFTAEEIAYAERFAGHARVARLASRFAAKEAVSKALGISLFSVSLRDISVVSKEGEAPQVLLGGKCREAAEMRNVGHVSVSISHERSNSVAFAVAFGKGERPEPAFENL